MEKEFSLVIVLVIVVVIGLSYGLITGNVVAGYSIPSGESVVLYLDMDGNSGGNNVGSVDCSIDGRFGGGCGFSGKNDYVDVGDIEGIEDSMTISFWAKSNVPDGDTNHLVQKYGAGVDTFLIRWSANEAIVVNLYGVENIQAFTSDERVLMDMGWHHIVTTYDGSVGKLYFDGVLQGSTIEFDGGMYETTHGVQIGRIDGVLDEMIIWSRALTSGEISDLYDAQVEEEEPEEIPEEVNESVIGEINETDNETIIEEPEIEEPVDEPVEDIVEEVVIEQPANEPAEEIVELECEYRDVYWSDANGNELANAVDGDRVHLSVEGENCDGKEVEFTIFESDGFIFGRDERGKEREVFRDGKVRKRYVVEWEEDSAFFGLFGDDKNEFVFHAKTNPEGESGMLFVDQGFGAQAGGDIYVDNQLTIDCVGDYSIVNRDCSGSDGDKYDTLQEAADVVVAGDTVLVRAGRYINPSTASAVIPLHIERSGTASQRITFKNYPSEKPIIDGTGPTADKFQAILIGTETVGESAGNYITIEGFEIVNAKTQIVKVVRASNTIIRNNLIHIEGFDGTQLVRGIVLSDGVVDALVESNEIYDNWQGIRADGSFSEQILRPIFRYNHVHHINAKVSNQQNHAICASFSGDTNVGNVGVVDGIIEYNVLHHCDDGGFSTNWAAGHVDRYNIAYRNGYPLNRWGTGQAGNGVGLKTKPDGIGGEDLVHHNIAFLNLKNGIELNNGANEIIKPTAHHNIAYKNGQNGFRAPTWDPSNQDRNAFIFNNIAVENVGNDIRFSEADETNYDYNIVGNVPATLNGYVADPGFKDVGILDIDLNGDESPDVLDSLSVPGFFVNGSEAYFFAKEKMNEIFGLESDSVAIDNGVDLGLGYLDFNENSEIDGDGDGSVEFDIGPMEYQGGTSGNVIYVDNNISGDCVDYNVTSRACGGGGEIKFEKLDDAMNNATAGDTVLMRDGIHDGVGVAGVYIAQTYSGGVAGSPITVDVYPEENATIEGYGGPKAQCIHVSHDYINIKNIECRNLSSSGKGIVCDSCNNLLIEGVKVHGFGYGVSSVAEGIVTSGMNDNITVRNSTIYRTAQGIVFGDRNNPPTGQIRLTNGLAENNYIYDIQDLNGENGIPIGARNCANTVIRNNVIHDAPEGYFMGCYNSTVEYNIAYDIGDGAGSGDDAGIKTSGPFPNSNLTVHHNLIYNSDKGIEVNRGVGVDGATPTLGDSFYYSNIVINSTTSGFKYLSGNATFIDNVVFGSWGSLPDADFRQVGGALFADYNYWGDDLGVFGLTEPNSLGGSDGPAGLLDEDFVVSDGFVENVDASVAIESIKTQFRNAFGLQAWSILIDNGTDVGYLDFDGNGAIDGNGNGGVEWDIGAFEFDPASQVNTYYVDDDCDGSGDGSIGDPFCTIQEGADIVNPGDTVMIKDGTYSSVSITRSGAVDERIIFRAENMPVYDSGTGLLTEPVVIDSTGVNNGISISASYISIEGMTVINSDKFGIAIDGVFPGLDPTNNNEPTGPSTTRGVTIDTCTVREVDNGSDGIGIKVRGTEETTIIRCVVYNSNSGIGFGNNVAPRTDTINRDSLIEANLVFDINEAATNGERGNAIFVSGHNRRITVRNNVAHDASDVGINGLSLYDSVIEDNVAYNSNSQGSINGDGEGIKVGLSGIGNIMRRNIVFGNAHRGFDDASAVDHTYYHNVAFDNPFDAGLFSANGGDPWVFNNIFWRNNWGTSNQQRIDWDLDLVPNPASGFYNNIFNLPNLNGDTNHIQQDPEFAVSSSAEIIVNENVLSDDFGDVTGLVVGSVGQDQGRFLTTASSASSGNVISVNDDPSRLFVVGDEIMIDNVGKDTRVITSIDSVASTITLDSSVSVGSGDGVSQAWLGSAPDIGAFEYQSSGPVSCTIDLECNDHIACTIDSCLAGSCNYDLSGCDCAAADANGDGDVNVVDLVYVANSFSAGDLLGDVNGDGEVDVLDMVFVASRIGDCVGY